MMTKSTQFGFSGSPLQPHALSSITQTHSHFGAFIAHILKSPNLTEFTCPFLYTNILVAECSWNNFRAS